MDRSRHNGGSPNADSCVLNAQLLGRFYSLLFSSHPSLSRGGGKKRYTIPPPNVQREGSKRTLFVNVEDICKRMHRSPEHVIQFMFSELGTSGSVDGSKRLVIKGRFQQKQIENVLRRYIGELQIKHPNSMKISSDTKYLVHLYSRIRYLQDMQIPRHPPHKRQPYFLRHLRDLRLQAVS